MPISDKSSQQLLNMNIHRAKSRPIIALEDSNNSLSCQAFLIIALIIFCVFFIGYQWQRETTADFLSLQMPSTTTPKYPFYPYSSFPFQPFCDKKQHHEKRYLALAMVAISAGNGIGNRLFEIFALLGMAKKLNRIPIFNSDDHQLMARINEMNQTLSRFMRGIEVMPIETTNSSRYTLFRQAQNYQYHKLFECDKSKFLVLDGFLYQSHRYFSSIEKEVQAMFDLEGENRIRIENMVPAAEKKEFKTCVHVRRGDFHESGFLEATDATFTIKAIKYLQEKNPGQVYIFSNDPDWVRINVFQNLELKSGVHIRDMTTKPEAINEIYFARLWCDAVLITAPASTFGWWMGYVAKGGENQVYYRDIFETKDEIRYSMILEDYFHPNWIKLGYGRDVKIIVKDQK